MDWNKLWKLIKKSAPKEQPQNHVPLMHEVIDLNNYPEETFLKWKNSDQHSSMIKQIAGAENADKNILPSPYDHLEFLNHQHSYGFVWMCQSTTDYELWDYRFMQHDFYRKLVQRGYYLSLADARSMSKNENLHLTYKYYLKPRRSKSTGEKMAQEYGNISIEFILVNDHPYLFRLMAHTYNDRNYLPAKPREVLMNILLTN